MLPACVRPCGGRGRFYGDLDEGFESFVGPGQPEIIKDGEATTRDGDTVYSVNGVNFADLSYDATMNARVNMNEYIQPYVMETDVFQFPDEGNGPSMYYILRNSYGDRRDRTWIGAVPAIDGVHASANLK